MTLFDSDPNLRWLFHPTHPDDELAFAAWARHLARQGNEVWMAWTHRTPIREKEARAAAALMGVHPERLRFHDAADGSACVQIDVLRPSFRALVAEARPDRVVCGAFEQGHLDHDATAFLLREAFAGPILEVPFYHTYVRPRLQTLNRFSDPARQEVRTLDEKDRRFKIGLARAYPSQTIGRIVTSYEIGHTLVGRRPELYATERARLMTVHDWRRPQHPEWLARRVAITPTWRRWLAALDAAGYLSPP